MFFISKQTALLTALVREAQPGGAGRAGVASA